MATTAKTGDKKYAEMLRKELPPDWELVPVTDGKRPYYWNKKTGLTTWKFPTADAEAHKAMVEDHLYQNVQIRSRIKPTDDSTSKKNSKEHNSLAPPQTVPPAVGPKPGMAEYSVVPQEWIEKKKFGGQNSKATESMSPPALPPRSELADQLDEEMYDIPVLPGRDTKKLPPKSSDSTSSVTVGNVLYQSASVASSKQAGKQTIEKASPTGSPLWSKKNSTLPKSSEVMYDVIADTRASKSATMPNRASSPEYAVIRNSPVLPLAAPRSPTSTKKALSPSREYDYISVPSAVKHAGVEEEKNKNSGGYYHLPVTARQHELRINSPPSPQLSHYDRLPVTKDSLRNGKQEWKIPNKDAVSSKKKRAVSVETTEQPERKGKSKTKGNSVDVAIEVLEKGLEDSKPTQNRSCSVDFSVALGSGKQDLSSGDMPLDWDDSDLRKSCRSNVQQSWMEQHNLYLAGRSYEEVEIQEKTGKQADSPQLPEKLKRGWSPRGVTKDIASEKLPAGWSKVVGEDGVYYWHVKSGKTQWNPPTEGDASDKLASGVDDDFSELKATLDNLQVHTINYATALTSSNDTTDCNSPKTFGAMALGWEEVDETELVKGQMVNVVCACIRRISTTEGDNLKDALATGGQGKEVFLQIQGLELRLLDPKSSTVLSVQQINKIRVWGIGKENERDFGYIARDQSTQRHKCHVFRCQVPAQAVARALVETHNKAKKSIDGEDPLLHPDVPADEESNRHPMYKTSSMDDDQTDAIMESSVTPTALENESYQRFECVYLGKVETKSAYGIDTIVDSLTKLSSDSLRWIEVFMDVASSHIKILDRRNEDTLQEHRVRFLSFLGINPKDEKYCGYIVDKGESQFVCHGFMAEPNTNLMCIALHGACQARFQRVLDSQPQQPSTPKGERRQTFSLFKRWSRKQALSGPSAPPAKSSEPLYTYAVQILGSQPVAQSGSLDNVKECIQQLSEKFKSSQAKQCTGDLEILSTGLTVVSHQKKLTGFTKKHYSFKNIISCVKLKNYFAFVYRESQSKSTCHVFAELEVDAATIVCAIQKTIMPLITSD